MMGLSAFRRISNDFAHLAVRQWGGGQPTNGRQDKSREVRPGRMGDGQRAHQRLGAMCATARQPASQQNTSTVNGSNTSQGRAP